MELIDTLLSEFSQAFYADDFQALVYLEHSISVLCSSSPDLEAYVKTNLEYHKFKDDIYYYEQSLNHLYNSDWDLISDVNDIKVESHYSGADFYTRASVLINSSIFEALSVITEEDLLPSWYFL